jgi:hypothetical protein
MRRIGEALGLVLLYVVMAGYVMLMLSLFVQMFFKTAIERHRRRRQLIQRNGGATYALKRFDGKRGWANTWLRRNPVINHPAQDGKSAGKLAGTAPIVKQAIALVSIVIAFGLAGTVAAQQPTGREITASTLKQQLLDLVSKETRLRMRLGELDEQLKPESIERELAGIGSTHPEELREHRRKLLTIERNGIRTQLDLLAEQHARTEAAIAEAESTTDLPDAQPSPAPLPKPVTDLAPGNFGAGNLSIKKSLVAMAMLPFVATGLILLLIVGFKRTRQRHYLLLILLFAQLCFPVSAQSQQSEPIRAFARGHGSIVSAVEERKFYAVLVVLREDGQALITIYSDLQLQARATWSATGSSPEVIQLKVTGGELNGNLSGSGRLLLSDDRMSLKELTITGRSFDSREMTLSFIADPSEPQTAHINLVS